MVTIILLRLSFAQDPGQVLAISDRFRVLRPKSFLTYADSPLAKGLRLCIANLRNVEFCQVVEESSGRRMLWSKPFFNDRDGLLPQRLGLLMVSLFIIEPGQQIKVVGKDGVPGLQDS